MDFYENINFTFVQYGINMDRLRETKHMESNIDRTMIFDYDKYYEDSNVEKIKWAIHFEYH